MSYDELPACPAPGLIDYTAQIPPSSLCDLLDRAVRNTPRRTALFFHKRKVSYQKLLEQAERVAANLRRHGLKAGERVAIMLPNLPQAVFAFWGVLKAGGVVVMTNPLYMEKELTHHLSDSGARFMITLDMLWSRIAPLRSKVPLEKIFVTRISEALSFPYNKLMEFKNKRAAKQKSGGKDEQAKIPFDDQSVLPWSSLSQGTERYSHQVEDPLTSLALLQYTGGTTGVSKGVMLTHYNLAAHAFQIRTKLEMSDADYQHSFVAVLPFFHVYGLIVCLLAPTSISASIILVPRYSPLDVLEIIKKHRPTVFPGAPALYISLMQQKTVSNYDLTCIHYCVSGSAAMPVSKFEEFQALTKARIIEGYGLTEASPVTHLNPLVPPTGPPRYGSIGEPIPFTEAKIVDMELGNIEMPVGVPGELVVRGPQVMLGYWNNPDETAGAIRNGWLYTGDIARVDEDGFYYIVDRKKDMYIVNGYNVYPREIDEVLGDHPKIFEAVTVGLPHGTRGETLKAFVVPKPGETITKEEVIAYCRKKLAGYKVPRRVEFRSELPKSAVGKILRRIILNEELMKSRAESS